MLKDFDFSSVKVEKVKRSELGEDLAKLQRQLKKTDSRMLVIVDGWESSGKGFVLKDLTRELDPRYHEVSVFENPTEEEENRTFLWRFFRALPKKGNIAFFDRSFYFQILNELQLSDKKMEHYLMDISLLERLLTADGTLVVKLFLHHKEKTMSKRIKELDTDPLRNFLISTNDKKQLKHYNNYLNHFDNVLKMTNFESSPWKIIPTEDLKDASRLSLNYIIEALRKHLETSEQIPSFNDEWKPELIKSEKPLYELNLDKKIAIEEYDAKKEKLQEKAGELLYHLWINKVPCLIVFEGTDAAGKGGAIQRLSRHMDPRGYDVATTAAPTEYENNYHYLWRFFDTFPEKGRLTIYDRSWYGRVLVERVEGFTPEKRWKDAYAEINEMEHNLIHEGHLLLKFLVVIDKKEQKQRFEARQNDPEKNYKLTDEDWRNHEKFNEYEAAMNDMIEKTNTSEAPWTIVEGNQKEYARIKVLETFIKEAEKFLKQI
ncbi:phosphate:AMP phosphotransferase [Jeotgalibaca sp. A122]|uniref:phosphate:AMP phosphotransferase n=1 Tax=Jeotgalibaca sp. A122 TaxID=3457322 RepID=UPI003FD3D034